MASRTRKSNASPVVSYVRELPGAVFFGDAINDDEALFYGAQAHEDAIERAEQLRAVFAELAGLSARKIAAALNERKIATPNGSAWHAATVIQVQKRLGFA